MWRPTALRSVQVHPTSISIPLDFKGRQDVPSNSQLEKNPQKFQQCFYRDESLEKAIRKASLLLGWWHSDSYLGSSSDWL